MSADDVKQLSALDDALRSPKEWIPIVAKAGGLQNFLPKIDGTRWRQG
jgi:hypothetical protein